MLASERLVELGIELPLKTAPLGAYLPAKRWGSRVFTSGQLPIQADGKILTGRLGGGLDVTDGQQAARTAVLNALAAITALLGHVDEIREVVRLMVYVNSSTAFTEQAKVANGASELLLEIFGDNGRHVRSAVGVAALPMNAAVEVELVVGV
ncbi:MAG: RidA family protein [Brooklawnia sp.]|uniref:RidA family protein n=1 Tax=Brooklawnia sp. TaxID=2699740 RepID=UPI003C743BF1